MTKIELIKATKQRYLKADKMGKTKILDEFCLSTELSRKYVIAIFKAGCDYFRISREGRKNRHKKYDSDLIVVAIKIWELLDYPCGARLKPMLPEIYATLVRNKEIIFNQKISCQLSLISARTLDRRLEKVRKEKNLKRNRGTTRHGSLLKSQIPIRITNWDTDKIGFSEVDTVAHNGGDPSGLFAYSLDLVEIFSGWSEQFAVLGKGEKGVAKALDSINKSLPFELKGIDSDSGGEFINWHMVKYCKVNKLFFTRSRPDRKNDNAYVEQKNNTHVRNWLGFGRYDTIEQVEMINDLYRNELRLFNNFFRPVMKIREKIKINNSVCQKKYDVAKTPYQRLLERNQISKEQKEKMTKLYLSLNPVLLKKLIDEKIRQIRLTAK